MFDDNLSMKPIKELLPELRKAKGWSRDRLSHEAFNIDPEGTSSPLIAGIELNRRRASARTMAALARALDVDPKVFLEYRLALAGHHQVRVLGGRSTSERVSVSVRSL